MSDTEVWRDPVPGKMDTSSSLTELKEECTESPSEERESSHFESGGCMADETDPEGDPRINRGNSDSQLEPQAWNDPAGYSHDPGETTGGNDPLTKEQVNTVELARQQLTVEQHERVDNCNKAFKLPSQINELKEAGESHRKGKGVDPKEWGQLHVDNELELDPEIQERLLNNCKERKTRKDKEISEDESDHDYEPDDESSGEEMDRNTINAMNTGTAAQKPSCVVELEAQLWQLEKELMKEKGKKKEQTKGVLKL
ncbi:hypothetical protein C0993_009503 [Termitomyces sp. T159_Od127]|nr:hypothetical protein C0993_009503 [Termitomyces sp. T159_Od127]